MTEAALRISETTEASSDRRAFLSVVTTLGIAISEMPCAPLLTIHEPAGCDSSRNQPLSFGANSTFSDLRDVTLSHNVPSSAKRSPGAPRLNPARRMAVGGDAVFSREV